MKFQKGTSGNPAGRPKGSRTKLSIVELEAAIKEVEREDKVNLYKHFVRRALLSDSVLIALIKKIIPDAVVENVQEEPDWITEQIEIIHSDINKERIEEVKRFLN